ncbi:CMRF35-like molecule 5 isoform X5 [Oncorhynchus nerka]|uniref:CMRF35-like molecule 5 isoform X5 n=1 Tax=Oncorhynchus nerka TaxID=8023 RepID=UPI0031B866E4
MKILHVVSCFLLSAVVCVLSGMITMRWKEGGNGHINCPYDRGYKNNPKYLSKGTYRNRVVVIQTHQHPAWTHKGRFSLYDDTERRVFTVTITNLVPEDSGTYWCGVDTWGPDQPTEVRLTVDRAPVPPNPGSITSRPLLSTSHITMTTDSSNSATDGTNGTVGTTASPPTDMARTQASKHSASLLVPDSMTTNLDPDTGTITNPIYATTTNQNPDTACDITTIYATATNPCPDCLYSNVGPTVSYTTVNFPRDPA